MCGRQSSLQGGGGGRMLKGERYEAGEGREGAAIRLYPLVAKQPARSADFTRTNPGRLSRQD